jgi:hypothetical protein
MRNSAYRQIYDKTKALVGQVWIVQLEKVLLVSSVGCGVALSLAACAGVAAAAQAHSILVVKWD